MNHQQPTVLANSTNPEPGRNFERREARQGRRRQRLRSRLLIGGTIAASLVLLAFTGVFYLQIQASLAYNAADPPVNGVACEAGMYDNSYHIHAHLSIFISGKRIVIPQGIGIAADGTCYYWLHTHTSDGIIHIEAPAKQSNLALDDFLTLWHARFANLNFPTALLQNSGWSIFIDGRPFAGHITSPLITEVPLASHAIVTLEYGRGNPPPDTPATYHFLPTLQT